MQSKPNHSTASTNVTNATVIEKQQNRLRSPSHQIVPDLKLT